MAVARDTTLVGTGTVNGGTSVALSNFSTGGANRLVLVTIDNSNGASNFVVSSVTATGLTFTLVSSIEKWPGFGHTDVWEAWASSTQTNVAVTVNFTGAVQGAARTYCFSGTISTGVASAAIGAIATNNWFSNGNPTTVDVTTTAANSLVIASVGITGDTTLTAGTGQTNDGTTTLAGQEATNANLRQNSITATSGTVVTMNGTLGTSKGWGIIGMEILEGTAPPPANTSNFFQFF